MNKWIGLMTIIIISSCNSSPANKILYQSDAFILYADSVVQGRNVARILSPTHIKSNYRSPTSETFSRLVSFKISINEKDNELPSGKDHWLIIGDEHEFTII